MAVYIIIIQVIFLIGEIDCREGILSAVEKCVYESLNAGIACTVKIFVQIIKELLNKRKFKVLNV